MKTQEEIEKMANEFSKDYIKTTNNSILQSSFKLEVGYIKGYKQCQEDMADEKYTEEDINEMACDFVINVGGLPKTIEEWQNALWKFYQSLNKQD